MASPKVEVFIDGNLVGFNKSLDKAKSKSKREGKKAGTKFGDGFGDNVLKAIKGRITGAVGSVAIGNIIADQFQNAAAAVRDFVGDSVNAFRNFETSLVGLQKTSDFTSA